MKAQSKILVKRNLRIFNEQAFINDLYHSDINFTSEIPDVEMALDYFSKDFLAIVDNHPPFKKLRIKDRSNPWFPLGFQLCLRQETEQNTQGTHPIGLHLGK